MIGDHDPEDEYDASDPIQVRLFVIAKIVQSLDQDKDLSRRASRRRNVGRLLRQVAEDMTSG